MLKLKKPVTVSTKVVNFETQEWLNNVDDVTSVALLADKDDYYKVLKALLKPTTEEQFRDIHYACMYYWDTKKFGEVPDIEEFTKRIYQA